jgi:CDP-2,3-bis-(O-geranylgeranyl)-sn-glycerol synthase
MIGIVSSTLETLWFFLPAFAGNIAPVIAARYQWLPRLNIPVDYGLTLGDTRLLGENKTIRGFVVGTAAGALTGILQYGLFHFYQFSHFSIVSYDNFLFATSLGALIGFGALFGDALKSFYKRRIHIPSGESWKPWDQIDIVIGVILVTSWFVPLTFTHVIISLFIIGIGMFIASYIGYITGIKQAI